MVLLSQTVVCGQCSSLAVCLVAVLCWPLAMAQSQYYFSEHQTPLLHVQTPQDESAAAVERSCAGAAAATICGAGGGSRAVLPGAQR
jgi:hypothetical protein